MATIKITQVPSCQKITKDQLNANNGEVTTPITVEYTITKEDYETKEPIIQNGPAEYQPYKFHIFVSIEGQTDAYGEDIDELISAGNFDIPVDDSTQFPITGTKTLNVVWKPSTALYPTVIKLNAIAAIDACVKGTIDGKETENDTQIASDTQPFDVAYLLDSCSNPNPNPTPTPTPTPEPTYTFTITQPKDCPKGMTMTLSNPQVKSVTVNNKEQWVPYIHISASIDHSTVLAGESLNCAPGTEDNPPAELTGVTGQEGISIYTNDKFNNGVTNDESCLIVTGTYASYSVDNIFPLGVGTNKIVLWIKTDDGKINKQCVGYVTVTKSTYDCSSIKTFINGMLYQYKSEGYTINTNCDGCSSDCMGCVTVDVTDKVKSSSVVTDPDNITKATLTIYGDPDTTKILQGPLSSKPQVTIDQMVKNWLNGKEIEYQECPPKSGKYYAIQYKAELNITRKTQPKPSCSNGQYKCENGIRYICQNGQWVKAPNQTECNGYNLMGCKGDTWTVIEQNSTNCGYNPNPNPNPNPNTNNGSDKILGVPILYWAIGAVALAGVMVLSNRR